MSWLHCPNTSCHWRINSGDIPDCWQESDNFNYVCEDCGIEFHVEVDYEVKFYPSKIKIKEEN